MRSTRFRPRRYQLKKQAADAVVKGHPWVFRDQMSSAAESFRAGQWLALNDAANQIVGYGLYEPTGAIAVRVLKRGPTPPDTAWLGEQLQKRLKRRDSLRKITNGFRAIHGENDGFPGVVVDVYGDHAVLQTYSHAVDSLGRWVALRLRQALSIKSVVWKTPVRRVKTPETGETRSLFGKTPARVTFREGDLELSADLLSGQKSGMFLDLRALRRWVSRQKLTGRRVLNLFCYTGSLSLAAEQAGATDVRNIDASQPALDYAKKFHTRNSDRAKWLKADVFEWLKETKGRFDLVIVDPPNMAAKKDQVPGALASYSRLYRAAAPLVAPGGLLVACCCTSRIPRKKFEQTTQAALRERGLKPRESLGLEDDHPVTFPEGDYLKILVYEAPRATTVDRRSQRSRRKPRHPSTMRRRV